MTSSLDNHRKNSRIIRKQDRPVTTRHTSPTTRTMRRAPTTKPFICLQHPQRLLTSYPTNKRRGEIKPTHKETSPHRQCKSTIGKCSNRIIDINTNLIRQTHTPRKKSSKRTSLSTRRNSNNLIKTSSKPRLENTHIQFSTRKITLQKTTCMRQIIKGNNLIRHRNMHNKHMITTHLISDVLIA